MAGLRSLIALLCLFLPVAVNAVTQDVNEGSSIDTTADTPASNDLMVMGGSGNPPTFLVTISPALKADYFGATPYASLGCSDLSGLSFGVGNFLPSAGQIFFIQDGTRYAKVRFNSVTPNVSINLTWDSLGSCSVDPPPVSSFTFTTYDLIGFFTDTSTNSPSAWNWNFGGAGTSSQQNPSFFFPSAASYSVELTASNTQTGNTASQNVTVSQQPSVSGSVGFGFDFDGDSLDDLSLLSPNGCSGNLTFGVSSGATYSFSSGDYRNIVAGDIPAAITGSGNFCAQEGVNGLFNPFFIQNSDGSVAKFWAPEVSGTSARIEFEILSAAPPPPPTTSWTFTTYDLIAFFTDTSTGSPGAWAWMFGDGNTSGQQNPTHFYAAGANTYSASLEASNTGGSGGIVAQQVSVSEEPSINPGVGTGIDFDGNGVDDLLVKTPNGCSGNVTFGVTNGATYSFASGDYRTLMAPATITSTGDFCSTEGVGGLFSPKIVETAAGSIVKFWTPSLDGAGTRMIFEVLTLITVPDAPVSIIGTGADGAALLDFTAPGNDGGAPILDYTADCGAGTPTTVTDDTQTIVVSGLTNGVTYSCTVTARNAAGSSAPSAAANVTPEATADLAITKIDSADPIIAGETLAYTLTVTNNGPDAATGVVISETLPAGVTFDSTSGCTEDPGGVPTCTIGGLASGSSAIITINVTVDAGTTGSVSNSASVSSTSTDDNAANDSATENTIVETAADLVLTKTDDVDPVLAGDGLVYTLTVTNNGPSDAQNVVITDNLPGGVTLTSSSGCAEDPNGAPTCSLGTIAAGASAAVTLATTVGSATTAALSNTATVTSATPEAQPGDESATESTTVITEADLSIGKTDDIDPVLAGNNLTYTITVNNAGPSDATGVVVTDTLPAGVALVSTTGCTEDPGAAPTCTLGSIAAGASTSYSVTVNVDPGQSGTLSNQATVASAVDDPDGANNATTENTSIDSEADLAVTKIDDIDPIVAGELLTYTIAVTNNGPSDAVNVVASDSLPTGATMQATSGCAEDPGGAPTCSLGGIAAGDTVQYTIEVALDPTLATGILTNTVAVASDTADPVGANDSTDETTNVTEQTADLTLSVATNAPVPADPGDVFDIIMQAGNDGPQDATGVVATVGLSPGLAFETTRGTACASHSAGVVTWNIGNLAAMTTDTCTFPVRLLHFGDLQLEDANIFGDQSDPDLGNNGATTAVLLRAPIVIPALGMIGLLLLATLLLGLTAIVRKGVV